MEEIRNGAVETRNITKMFGGITAVNQITFRVAKGEIFGLLGPNGAGKTTTIRMLTGLITPDTGEICIDGIDINKDPIRGKMRVGVIPEMGNSYVDLTAKQNIVFSGRFYGYSRRELERKAESLLEKFELSERKDDPVRTYSKGMKQRVNIASALVHDPEILFLDEPFTGLDVKSQRLIKDIIKQMNRRGTTIFLTTHNVEDANLLCDRVCIMNKGRVIAIDSPESLKKSYKQAQSIEIAFQKQLKDHSVLKSDSVHTLEKLGDKWKLHTNNPDKVIKHLVTMAEEKDLTITSLSICKPYLEDIFIALTEGKGYEC